MLPDILATALAVAAGAAPSRPSALPVLNHVLIEATPDGGVIVTGADLETRAWHTVSAKVDEAGAVTLPSRPLADFLDSVKGTDDALTITVNAAHKAELVCGRTRARMAGIDYEQFPSGQSFDDPSFDTTLAADLLLTLIRSVVFAIAPKDDRPILAGVLLRSDGTTLQAAAADGFRLAVRSIGIEAPDLNIIAQGRTLAKATSLLAQATSVRMTVDAAKSALLLDTEAGCWSVRLISGDFPDFNRIIPRDTSVAVTVQRAALLRALSLVQRIESADLGHRVHLSVEADRIGVRASSTEEDYEAETSVDAELTRGEPMRISLRERHLRDAIGAFESASVTLEMHDATRPVLIRAPGSSPEHSHILMPLAGAR